MPRMSRSRRQYQDGRQTASRRWSRGEGRRYADYSRDRDQWERDRDRWDRDRDRDRWGRDRERDQGDSGWRPSRQVVPVPFFGGSPF